MPRKKNENKKKEAKKEVKTKKAYSKKREKTATSSKKKVSPKKKEKKISSKKEEKKKIKYIEKIGRRKTSTARVRFYETEEKGRIIVNKKDFKEYFPVVDLQKTILDPIEKTENFISKRGKIEILVKGGGKRGQAEAIQLGMARLILQLEPKYKSILKANGFLRRDPRMVERKKFGLKKARRAPQWQKR